MFAFLQGKKLIFDHFLRANFNPGSTAKYYITFAARESDSPDAPLVEYQAKAARCAGKTYPILCRPAPSPNKGNFSLNINDVISRLGYKRIRLV